MFTKQIRSGCMLAGIAMLLLLSGAQSRPSTFGMAHVGRNLLDVSLSATSDSTFTEAISYSNNAGPNSQCTFQQGTYSPVSGPLSVTVAQGKTATVNFEIAPGSSLSLQQAPTGVTYGTSLQKGLTSAALSPSSMTPVGSTFTITAVLVNYQQQFCQMTVNFIVGAAPTPPAPATPPPTPTPVYPKNPCYCSPASNGQSACFNFNQASSDINCAPQYNNCKQTTAAAGQYSIQAGGPIFLCSTA